MNKDDLADSRYVWLPLTVEGDDVELRWRGRWGLSAFDDAMKKIR